MNLAEMLEKLRKEALADPGLRRKTSGHQKGKSPVKRLLQPLPGAGLSDL